MDTKRKIKEFACNVLIGATLAMIAKMEAYREYCPEIAVEGDKTLVDLAMKLYAECNRLNYQISEH